MTLREKMFPFLRENRITNTSEFNAMYSQGKGKTVGPLLIHRKKNELGRTRLGLSVPKKVGNAVQRNRVKRKCREAFRLTIQFLPTGTDILITVRPHATLEIEEYKELILKGVSC